MNFKTPFKVLTTAALIGTLAVSAVAPGVASAASETKVSQKATANFAIDKLVFTKEGSAPIVMTYAEYEDAYLIATINNEDFASKLNGYKVSYVVTGNQNVYDYTAFENAYLIASLENDKTTSSAVLEELASKPEGTTTLPADAKEGTFGEDGKLVAGEPVAEDFKVTEIAAITESGVEVSFPALTADKEDVTIEVKDSKGAVHAVKAVNLSKGDAKATFEFEKAVATADLTGKWTIGKASYDFDAIKQLEDIKSAAQGEDFVKLLKALKAGSITDVAETDAALKQYKTAITEAAPTTLAEVQEAIAEANEELAKEDASTKAVDAVAKAKGQVALLKALQDGFKRVNSDWISSYAGGKESVSEPAADSVVGILITEGASTANKVVTTASSSATGVVLSSENIQSTIDEINKQQISQTWDEAWDNADAKELAKFNALAGFLADDTDEQKVVKEYYADEAKRLEAVINVNTVAASTATNGSFEKAVQALDAVENELVAKYKGTQYAGNFAEGLDITTLKADLLSKYREELKTTPAGDRNQASDIQKVINKVNSVTLNTLLTTLKDADTAYTTALTNGTDTEKATTEAAFLKALKAVAAFDTVTFKNVTIEDKRAALYVDSIDLSGATLDADNATTNSTTVKGKVVDTNTNAETQAVDAIKTAAAAAKTADDLLTALESKELVLANVVKANKDAYKAADFTSVADKKAVQTLVNQVNALVAINAAKTATEVQAELGAFNSTEYTDVTVGDRGIVAQLVLDARNAAAGKQFANVAAASAALVTASDDVVDTLDYVNDGFQAEKASAIVAQFIKGGLIAADVDALEASEKVQAFQSSLTYTDAGKTSPAFKSLTEVKEALNK